MNSRRSLGINRPLFQRSTQVDPPDTLCTVQMKSVAASSKSIAGIETQRDKDDGIITLVPGAQFYSDRWDDVTSGFLQSRS